jgi:hypothetical protein
MASDEFMKLAKADRRKISAAERALRAQRRRDRHRLRVVEEFVERALRADYGYSTRVLSIAEEQVAGGGYRYSGSCEISGLARTFTATGGALAWYQAALLVDPDLSIYVGATDDDHLRELYAA